jgi:hypothetical protein
MRCTLSIVVALLGGVGLAVAQQPAPPVVAQQQSQPEKAQQTPSGKMGTEEPSPHAPAAKPGGNAVFVNGALAVPGAPADSDTVPAKFSAKNAADDKLITVAYTFKSLTPDQRRAIYQALKDRPAGSAFSACSGEVDTGSPTRTCASQQIDVGTELPHAVDLHAMPDEVAMRVPQTKDYQYAVADNRVLLVSPPTRIVVGVFPEVNELDAGGGRRSP